MWQTRKRHWISLSQDMLWQDSLGPIKYWLHACIALPDATPEELYFRLHEDPAEEIARKRRAPLVVGNFRRETTVGEIPRTDSVATQGAIRRKRWVRQGWHHGSALSICMTQGRKIEWSHNFYKYAFFLAPFFARNPFIMKQSREKDKIMEIHIKIDSTYGQNPKITCVRLHVHF